jgi:hypothetical protein
MRIKIRGEEYRLFFRYKWEQPGGASRPNGTVELRHATWTEVPDDLVGYGPGKGQDKLSDVKRISPLTVWRTTEAVLAKVTGREDPSENRPHGRDKLEEVAKGITRCSPQDKFSKESGRRQALHRLLVALPGEFTGFEKGRIWSIFAERKQLAEYEAMRQKISAQGGEDDA